MTEHSTAAAAFRTALAAVLAASLAACERPVPAGAPVASAPKGVLPAAPFRDTALVSALSTTIEAVDTTVTYRAWMTAHPADRATEDMPEGAVEEHVCRVASTSVPIAGRTFTRYAVFNELQPPPGERWPASTKDLAGDCTLRGIWLVTAGGSFQAASSLADSLTLALDAALGAHQDTAAIHGVGTGDWVSPRGWRRGSTAVTAAVIPAIGSDSSAGADDDTSRPAQAIVVALAPGSGIGTATGDDFSIYFDSDGEGAMDAELANAEVALQVAGDTVFSSALHPLLAGMRGVERLARTPALDAALVRAAREARITAPRLDPARRSAMLAALDIGINGYTRAVDDSADALLIQLRGAGIAYVDDHLAASMIYTRDPLREAWRLDSLGAGGHAALIALLSAGWYSAPMCGTGDDETGGFDAMIAHGEAALARGQTDPMIHYYVGLAYADVVSMAQSDDDYHQSKDYKPREAASRAKAISHLRAALDGLTDRGVRRHAWRIAAKLAMGHEGDHHSYFCVYD